MLARSRWWPGGPASKTECQAGSGQQPAVEGKESLRVKGWEHGGEGTAAHPLPLLCGVPHQCDAAAFALASGCSHETRVTAES